MFIYYTCVCVCVCVCVCIKEERGKEGKSERVHLNGNCQRLSVL